MLSFQDCLCPPLLHPDSCSSSSHSFMCSLEDYLWEVVIAGYKSKLGKRSSFHIWHKWFLMAYIILYLISDIDVCFEFPVSSVYMELSSNISPQSRSRELIYKENTQGSNPMTNWVGFLSGYSVVQFRKQWQKISTGRSYCRLNQPSKSWKWLQLPLGHSQFLVFICKQMPWFAVLSSHFEYSLTLIYKNGFHKWLV